MVQRDMAVRMCLFTTTPWIHQSGLKHMAHFYQYEVHRVREWLKTDDEETIVKN